MKNPEVATAVENVLAEVARIEATKPKPQPKPPAPKFKPPVRSTEEQIIEDMTADQFKAAVAKGRGAAIESILSRRKS